MFIYFTCRLTSEQSAKYTVFLSTSLVASYTATSQIFSFHSLHPTQSVVEQAIDYLSSFLKVERLTQNITLQRWVPTTPETVSPEFTKCSLFVGSNCSTCLLHCQGGSIAIYTCMYIMLPHSLPDSHVKCTPIHIMPACWMSYRYIVA